MNKDNQEIEIKIKLDDAEALKKKILELGGKKTYESLNQDTYFDNDAHFYESGNVLRLRKEQKGTLFTFKGSLENDKSLLKREEIQTYVTDEQAIALILQRLGYWEKYKKEKKVEYYELDGFNLEFHVLPFLGNFLEIEAPEENLKNILGKLGLDLGQGIPKGYNSLFSDYKKSYNLPDDTQLTFDAENM
jgi:predicted adenylyl cyclase CyaB